jgi:hypothetical protein
MKSFAPGGNVIANMVAKTSGKNPRAADTRGVGGTAPPMKKKKKHLMMKACLIGFILFGPSTLRAQQPQFNTTQYRGGFASGKEKLTVSSTAKALTSSVYAPICTDSPPALCQADYAYITVETDALRWWPHDDPTSTDGHLQPANTSFTVWGFDNIVNLRMIRVTTDATIQVSYYRFSSNTVR